MIRLELVDRDNRVVGHHTVGRDAFPLTIRLADGYKQATQPHTVAAGGTAQSAMHVTHAPASRGLWRRLMSPGGAAAAVTVAAGVLAAATYSHMFAKSNRTALVGAMLGYLMLFTLWAGGWALGGRVVQRRARFRDQFTWTCICALGMLALGYAARWEQFLFPASDVLETLAALAGVLAAIAALYGHLSIASHMPPWRRWRTAVATVGVFVALSGLAVYANSGNFDTSLRYNASIQPLDARFVPAEPVAKFTREIGALQRQVDAEAKKP